jgi:hypothetical protein
MTARWIHRLILSALLSLGSYGNAIGRGVPNWTYDDLTHASEFVVIAKTLETISLAEIQSMHGGQMVVIETTFEVEASLKGTTEGPRIVVRHYKPVNALLMHPDSSKWVSFEVNKTNAYLLFLRRREDGRYEFVSGNDDPYISVKVIPQRPLVSALDCHGD